MVFYRPANLRPRTLKKPVFKQRNHVPRKEFCSKKNSSVNFRNGNIKLDWDFIIQRNQNYFRCFKLHEVCKNALDLSKS